MVWRVGIIRPVVWIAWLSGVAASHLVNSLKAKSIITSLLFGRGQGVTQLLAARQRHSEQEPARIAVAKRRIAESRVIPGLQRALGPARTCQDPRARDFEGPCACSLAILGVGLDDESDMRVGPVDGLDGAFHGFGMIEI